MKTYALLLALAATNFFLAIVNLGIFATTDRAVNLVVAVGCAGVSLYCLHAAGNGDEE